MCGICGFVDWSGEADAHLRKMTTLLRHRGPDAGGFEQIGAVHLGHRRLSVIDLTPNGAQPMWDATGSVCISYNGEIYNFRELREECVRRGADLRGTSDTEVIINLFLLEGENAFARLDGMFAFCLVDTRAGTTYLVRDPMGVKPLYYFDDGGGLCFASELPALLRSGTVPFEIDRDALHAYLRLDYVPSPLCIVKGVRKLGPGQYLRLGRDGSRLLRTFTSWDDGEAYELSDHEALERFDALMRQSVERQLVADVPTGVFLSGGIDSSIVASVASKVIDRPLHTFSIGFEEESFDETPFSDEVAAAIGSVHHRKIVGARDALEIVAQLPRITGEPLADGSILPTYLLCRFARERVTVALSGDGADELFGGYPTYGLGRTADLLAGLPMWATRIARGAASLFPEGDGNLTFGYKARRFLSGLHSDEIERHFRWMGTFPSDAIASLVVDADVAESDALRVLLAEPSSSVSSRGRLERLLRTDQRFYLQDQVLVKADRASMAVSLEVRPPFLSEPIVRFARALPARFKVRGRSSKHLLREWLSREFPSRISRRPKKGFGAPLARWLRSELRDLVGDLLSESVVRRHGLLEFAPVDRLVREHWLGERDRRKELFNLVSLALWMEEMGSSAARSSTKDA